MDGHLDYPDTRSCPACHHGNVPMGRLGSREHFRCRYCGLDYSSVGYDDVPENDFGALYNELGGEG
jgi:rubredoxin